VTESVEYGMQQTRASSSIELTSQGGGAATTTAPPPPGLPGGPVIVGGGPLSGLSLRELRAHRDEISSQLSNVAGRRADLATQLRNAAPGVDRKGLEDRISSLDQRILALEGDLNATGFQLAALRGQSTTTEDPPGPPGNAPDRDQITAIAIVFTLVVLMPLSIAWARAIFRRAARQAEQPSAQLMNRLDRMEEGIETIALEVERISEGQRFVTKVISGGAAEPVAIPNRERVELER
jgi:hypothetical protein